ncbi:MAG: 30S ribosome-binding factor RbfA [Chlorobi bacterium]|nr:30S ribosome-binding factor RbfA [Chlorobiota bacterium]
MESKRQQRIAKQLQKDLGEIMQREVHHVTRGAMVTVTKVHVTPDLLLAKVYLSLFATKDKKALLENIRKHASEIRGKLGSRIKHQMRAVPELHFFEDDSLDYIERIEEILK